MERAYPEPPLGYPCRLGYDRGAPGSPNTSQISLQNERSGHMAKDHGPSVKDDKQYEGLRKKGMSKSRAAKIANTPDASKKGGKRSGGRKKSS
jgi:hypothetical protein